MKTKIAIAAVGAALATGLLTAPAANADYVRGCERIDWGFANSGYRTICDGPKAPDGSWERERREWTPAHWYTPYCSYRALWCSGPIYVEESTQSWTTYRVTDDTVPQGGFLLAPEPAWMPPGTNRIL